MKVVISMKKLMISLIHKYQHIFRGKQPTCRFRPTCSQYTIDAYTHHNFFYATLLSIWRIIRCNPLVKGGYDPIPKFKKELKAQLKAEALADNHKDEQSCHEESNQEPQKNDVND